MTTREIDKQSGDLLRSYLENDERGVRAVLEALDPIVAAAVAIRVYEVLYSPAGGGPTKARQFQNDIETLAE